MMFFFFFFQAEDGIRDGRVTGVQTCALPICRAVATRTGLRMADTPHGGPATPADGRLRGRVGLITGAASGIGAAGAELFAAQGAALVLVDLDAAQGERVADAITARRGHAVFVHGDAASADDISGAVATAVAEFGKLDL